MLNTIKYLGVQQDNLMLCCGSVGHQSNTCPQVEMCPTYETKNYGRLYICPLLKNMKDQEKDYRGYESDDSS